MPKALLSFFSETKHFQDERFQAGFVIAKSVIKFLFSKYFPSNVYYS